MDDFFRVATALDWISPLLWIVHKVHGQKDFTIIDSNGYTCRQAMNRLKKHGVRVGSPMILGDELHLTVDNVARAEWVMEEYGMAGYGR